MLGSTANPDRTPEQTDTVQLQDAENWVADVYHQHPLRPLAAARREALMWMAYMDAMSHLSDAPPLDLQLLAADYRNPGRRQRRQ